MSELGDETAPPRRWLRALASLVAIVAGAAALAVLAQPGLPRLLVLAIDAEDASRLCQKPACSLGDLWERARAAGAAAVVMRPRPLKVLAQRGEVLHVTREEFEKWKALGLIAPGATLKPDTIWIKDRRVVAQVLDAVLRQGVSVTTASSSGYTLVQFPEGYSSVEESLGAYDAELVESLQGSRLVPVYAQGQSARLSAVGLRWQRDGRVVGFEGSAGDWALDAIELGADSGSAPLLRSGFSRPARLLVLRWPVGGDLDSGLAALRRAQRKLTTAGLLGPLPAQPPVWPQPPQAPWALRVALWALAFLGPLLAARAGLTALRSARVAVAPRWPVASPVLQIAAGLLAMGACAAALGVLARVCFERLGQSGPPSEWLPLSFLIPVIVGLLTLYTIDLEEWAEWSRRPLSRRMALGAAALLAASALLIEPRSMLGALDVWPILSRLEAASGGLWWLAWRWREALVGVPCLVQAMVLIDRRLECPDCAAQCEGVGSDARTWFLPGLLAPAGVIAAVARRGVPLDLALAHTGLALVLGGAVGLAVCALRQRRGPKGPDPHRSLVLDTTV